MAPVDAPRPRPTAAALLVALLTLALLGPWGSAASADTDTTPPVIDWVTFSPSTPYVYLSVNFTAAAHDDESGIASLIWSFGDGATATGAIASHVYTDSGSMTVTLTAADAAGNTTISSRLVQVSAFQPEPSYVAPDLERVRLRPGTISARGLTRGVPRRARLAFRVVDSISTARVTMEVRDPRGQRARRVLGELRNGSHRVRIGAQVGATTLAPGRYRVVVRASNDYGSETSTVRLRIVP